jgi:hypothetical protein
MFNHLNQVNQLRAGKEKEKSCFIPAANQWPECTHGFESAMKTFKSFKQEEIGNNSEQTV